MGQSEAEFDRALGAWEDSQLNSHLAEEEAYEKAYEEAEVAVWDMKLGDLMDLAPVGAARKIEEVVELMSAHIVDLGD
tara:strand:- start:272 stop:505 length:234 start_codon:yes stop_codon:yes gene_type:complete